MDDRTERIKSDGRLGQRLREDGRKPMGNHLGSTGRVDGRGIARTRAGCLEKIDRKHPLALWDRDRIERSRLIRWFENPPTRAQSPTPFCGAERRSGSYPQAIASESEVLPHPWEATEVPVSSPIEKVEIAQTPPIAKGRLSTIPVY